MKLNLVERGVLDPLAESSQESIFINDIPSPIHHISLFDNTKPGANIILNIIKASLKSIEVIESKKPAGAGANKFQLEKAAEGDVSILALGDCGSCTTWVILDAIRLEKKGVPTLSICSHKFAPFARKLAKAHGAPDLRIFEIEHPVAGLNPDKVKEKTDVMIPEIKKIFYKSD
ncbi:MAG: hypothetical protein CIT03_06910 [Methanobacterium sp.]|nr:MAG: hypothetical protein CIT03_06910 [Methanobacterium sp.]